MAKKVAAKKATPKRAPAKKKEDPNVIRLEWLKEIEELRKEHAAAQAADEMAAEAKKETAAHAKKLQKKLNALISGGPQRDLFTGQSTQSKKAPTTGGSAGKSKPVTPNEVLQ